MDMKQLKQIIAEAVDDADLKSSEIPEIDLYLDQITSLVSSKLLEASERYRDNILTKTMINNYSKDQLIKPLNGKKYTKEHILQILLIYSLKSTLSITEIKRLLHGIYMTENFDGGELLKIYDRHVDLKAHCKDFSAEIIEELFSSMSLDSENENDYCAAILAISALSSYMKNIAQSMIEHKYPELLTKEQEKGKEKEKEKEKKKKEKREK
jgi:hypothetical protein